MNPTESYSFHYAKSCTKNNIDINDQFVTWINTIENSIFTKYNLRLRDIPDELYMVSFEGGMTSDEMTKVVFDNLVGMFS